MWKYRRKTDKKRKKGVSPEPEVQKTEAPKTGVPADGKSYYSTLVGFHRAVPIILVASGLFTALCFFNLTTGILGDAIVKFLRGLFSYGAYIIPLLLVVHGVFYPSDIVKKRALSRLIFSVATVLFISVVAYAVMYVISDPKPAFTPNEYYAMGQNHVGGGFFGSLIGYGIIKIFGSVGLFIITSAVFAIYVVYFFSDGTGVFAKICLGILSGIAGVFAGIERGIKSAFCKSKNRKAEKEKRISVQKSLDLGNDDFFMVDGGMQDFEISELGIKQSRDTDELEENPTLHDKVRMKSATGESVRTESAFADGFFDAKNEDGFSEPDPTVKKRTVLHTDINLDDAVGTDERTADDIIYESRTKSHAPDSADSVFARDFSPFDLTASEKLARQPSSRAGETQKRTGAIFTEDISNITPEDIERARRQAEFDMKKRSIMDDYREKEAKLAEERRLAEEARLAEERRLAEEARLAEERRVNEQTVRPETPTHNFTYDSYGTEIRAKEPASEQRRPYAFTPNLDATLGTDIQAETPRTEAARGNYERAARFSDAVTGFGETVAKESELQQEEPTVFEWNNPSVADGERPTITLEREFIETEDTDTDEDGEISADALLEGEEEDSAEEPTEIPEAEQNPVISEYRKMFTALSDEDEDGAGLVFTHEKPVTPTATEAAAQGAEDEPPFEVDEPEEEPEAKAPPKPKKSYASYKFPPISILAPEDADENEDIQAEIEDNANKLISTLESFRVKASIKGVDRGPRITRYEIVPATGVKVSSIMSLQNDIALNLAAEGIRMEAPIPGKSAIGFEVPNRKPSTVRLRSLLETDEFVSSKSKTQVCIGKDVAGCPVFGDIAKMPHVLIAGATGMGKSVCINSILISMLYKARPDEVKFIMIDPKKVEFTMYNGIPHLLIPVVTDPKQAAGALMWAVEQMEKRYEMIEQMRVRNIEMYNEKIAKDPSLGEPMSKIIVVIDELNDLMLQVRDPVEGLIMSIAQKARAAGIHLIIGTQRPSVDVITGVIKANIPSRIACKVMSNTDSRTILDQKGAEDLLDKGDMLFFPAGKPKPARVQGAFVSDGEVEEIMEFLKAQGGDGENYDSEVMEEIQRNAQRCNKKNSDDSGDDDGAGEDNSGYLNDQKFLDAVNIAVTTGKISTALLQRKLSIGYGRAAKYVDIMEDMGIVSESNGQKAREVLITRDEWHEKLARISLDDY